MPFARQNTKQTERIGQLQHWLSLYAPTVTPTAHRGLQNTWVTMATVKGHAEMKPGSAVPETLEADRTVAINTMLFTIRTLSGSDVRENWAIKYAGRYYQILRIDDISGTGPRRSYLRIEAQRRDDDIQPVENITVEPGVVLVQGFSQRFSDVTSDRVTVTAGLLPDTMIYTEQRINQILYVFRSGQRMSYGSAGPDGYTIDVDTNRIIFNLSLEAENVLITQYGFQHV